MRKTKKQLQSKPKIKQTKELLKTQLTKEEIAECSQLLVEHLQTVEILKEEKKASMSSYNSRIDEMNKEISRLGSMVRDKYEYRYIDCNIIYNTPKNTIKTIIRTDTDTEVRQEPMTDLEKQENLFDEETK